MSTEFETLCLDRNRHRKPPQTKAKIFVLLPDLHVIE